MPTTNNRKEKASTKQVEGQQPEATLGSTTGEQLKRWGAIVEDFADAAVQSFGSGMESFGTTIHEHGPEHGSRHNGADKLAGTLESGGRYLESHGLNGVAEDISNLIRRNPVPALLVGVGVGLLIARMLKR